MADVKCVTTADGFIGTKGNVSVEAHNPSDDYVFGAHSADVLEQRKDGKKHYGELLFQHSESALTTEVPSALAQKGITIADQCATQLGTPAFKNMVPYKP